MRTSINLFHVAVVVFLFGCNCGPGCEDSTSSAAVIRTEIQSVISSGTPITTASLGIEGMSCSIMCGGAIKKALEGVHGVISAEIEFDADKDIDIAIVKYSAEEVQDARLVSVVNEIREGAYKVRTVEVDTQIKDPNKVSEENNEEETAALVPGKVRLISLLDLVFSIVDL